MASIAYRVDESAIKMANIGIRRFQLNRFFQVKLGREKSMAATYSLRNITHTHTHT